MIASFSSLLSCVLLMPFDFFLLHTSFQFYNKTTITVKRSLALLRHYYLLVCFYLRKLSCRCGSGEGVGHHGAKYIQVIVVLACACATIVSWCSCWCVCNKKVKKMVLQVDNKITHLGKSTLWDNLTEEGSKTHWSSPNMSKLKTYKITRVTF